MECRFPSCPFRLSAFISALPMLTEVYRRLFDAFGPQHWWPGESPFEVMVGAVLTQNTVGRTWSGRSATSARPTCSSRTPCTTCRWRNWRS